MYRCRLMVLFCSRLHILYTTVKSVSMFAFEFHGKGAVSEYLDILYFTPCILWACRKKTVYILRLKACIFTETKKKSVRTSFMSIVRPKNHTLLSLQHLGEVIPHGCAMNNVWRNLCGESTCVYYLALDNSHSRKRLSIAGYKRWPPAVSAAVCRCVLFVATESDGSNSSCFDN